MARARSQTFRFQSYAIRALTFALLLIITFPHSSRAQEVERLGDEVVEPTHASADVPDEEDDSEGDLCGQTSESGRYILQSIEIRGNRRTRDSVILREISLEPGQILDVDDIAIELSRYRLLASGFFSEVNMRLRRGARRGQVILVVEVEERWTFIVREIFLGVSEITPYGGLSFEETNLLGLGINLSGAFVAGEEQQAHRFAFTYPRLGNTPVALSFSFLYNDARDFLGRRPVRVSTSDDFEPYAIVDYRRVGGSIGTGISLNRSLSLYVQYRFEMINAEYPAAAAQLDSPFGPEIGEPIDFHLARGRSYLSALVLSLDYDTRDHPFLPSRGRRLALETTVASDVIGSHYHYFKMTLRGDLYLRFPWNHTLHFGLVIGTIFGEAPLYEMYFIGDLSDQLHSRVLDLNFSHAPAPNIFRTSIEEMRYESLAGRLDIEYIVPLYRGRRVVYGLDFFLLMGLYSIGSSEDFRSPPAGYEGGAFPIDLTVDVGFRLDTTVGVIGFSFKNLLGLIPFAED